MRITISAITSTWVNVPHYWRKSVKLLVFSLQNKLRKAEFEINDMKRETDAEFSKIESAYDAVRDDFKIFSQNIANWG